MTPAKKILVVDDDQLIRNMLNDALSSEGYEIIQASDGNEAILAYQENQPDLVILDLFMPQMDGFEVCQKIRASATGSSTPVIVLTALEDADSVRRAFDAGATDFLPKPLRMELIKYRVNLMLNEPQQFQLPRISSEEGASIIESIPDPIVIYDTDMKIVWANDAAEHYLGRPISQSIGVSCKEVCRVKDCEKHLECINRRCIESGKVLTGMNHHADETVWGLRVFPICNDQGEYDKILCLAHDITEKVKLQADAAYANQLVHIGELAAGIAHEINNPLSGIINYSQLMINQLADDSPLRDLASKINTEGERVSRIANSLLTFSWRGRHRGVGFENLYEIVAEALTVVQPQMKTDGIQVEFNIPTDLQDLELNRQAIQQVLLNIFSNASYAMNERHGDVEGAKVLQLSSRLVEINGKGYIELEIKDNGSGVPAKQIGLLKMPFFTTRPEGAGSGIGLSICHKIIKEHHGELLIDSKEGEYTAIKILLPCDSPRPHIGRH